MRVQMIISGIARNYIVLANTDLLLLMVAAFVRISKIWQLLCTYSINMHRLLYTMFKVHAADPITLCNGIWMLYKSAFTGNRPPNNQRIDFLGAFVGVYCFRIGYKTGNVIF
jgi:hypothetical protein